MDDNEKDKKGTTAATPPVPPIPPAAPKKGSKKSFSTFIQERGLTPSRVTVLERLTGWDGDTEITEAEFDAAFQKHLRNKEA